MLLAFFGDLLCHKDLFTLAKFETKISEKNVKGLSLCDSIVVELRERID